MLFFAPSSIPVWALTQYQCTFDTFQFKHMFIQFVTLPDLQSKVSL